MAYGTAAQVAAFAKIYTSAGSFTTSTNPTLAEITQWLTDISALMDAALANVWFDTPIDVTAAPQVHAAISNRVCVLVADLCAFTNHKGRLFTDRVIEIGPMNVINKEINAWINDNAIGFENLGATRLEQSGSGSGSYSIKMDRQTS